MKDAPEMQEAPPATYRNAARRFYFTVPLYLLVPVGFWLAFLRAGMRMNWAAFGIGAAGWFLALMLRGPVAVLVKNLPRERASVAVGSASGPLEEGIRTLALALTGTSFRWGVSLGQGWAAVEVLFTLVNGAVLLSVIQGSNEKAAEARKFLETTGNLNVSPMLGVVERVSASAFHIGSTLLIAADFWLAAVMAPIHTGVNLAAMRLAKKSPVGAEMFIGALGLAVFLAGLFMFV